MQYDLGSIKHACRTLAILHHAGVDLPYTSVDNVLMHCMHTGLDQQSLHLYNTIFALPQPYNKYDSVHVISEVCNSYKEKAANSLAYDYVCETLRVARNRHLVEFMVANSPSLIT